MSNKTQLQTNNTKLDDLTSLASSMKEKVAALPDAGNVETCTVTITSDSGQISTAGFTTYENNKISSYCINGFSVTNTPVTIENVVCGAMAFVNATGYSIPGYAITNGTFENHTTLVHGGVRVFNLSAEAGANVTINCFEND